MSSTASFTRVSWGRSSSFQKESGKNKDADGETINSDQDVMVMTMSSSSAVPTISREEESVDVRDEETTDARDDAKTDDLEKETVSVSASASEEEEESDSSSSSEESFSMDLTATDSISMASTKSTKSTKSGKSGKGSVQKSKSTEDFIQGRSSSNLEAKERANEKTEMKRDLPPLAPKAKTTSSASLPPLPPAISHRRVNSVSSTASGMGRKLKKIIPSMISRSFSNPKKTVSADSEDPISFSFEQSRAASKDNEGRDPVELSRPRSENDEVVLIETVDTVETASVGGKDSLADVKSESSGASEDEGETIGSTEDSAAEPEAVASVQLEETTAAASFQVEEETAATSFHVEEETAATSFQVEEETAATSFQAEEETAATSFQAEEETAATSFQVEDETVDTSVQEETVATSVQEETVATSVQSEEKSVTASVKSEEKIGPAMSDEGETIAEIIAKAEAQALLDTIIDKVKEGADASNDDVSTGEELDKMVFAVDSGYGDSKERKEDTKEEEVDPVLSAGSDDDRVSAVDSGLNDIQDPWPNPWLDAEMNGELPEASDPVKPNESAPTSAPETVLERVVGVAPGLEDHSVASEASQPKVRASITGSSSLLSHMKARVEKNGGSANSIPSEKEQDDAESVVTQHTDHQSTLQPEVFVARAPLRECITLEDNVEAAILNHWDSFAPEPGTDASSLREERNKAGPEAKATAKAKAGAPAGSKAKPVRTQSFWKKAKKGPLKKKENDGESKPTIGKKFKLAYLFMLKPCKKADARKAVDEKQKTEKVKAQTKAESADIAISPSVAKSTSASPDDIMDMEEMGTRTVEELDHILNPNESHDDLTAADPMPDSTMQALQSDAEETKEDVVQTEEPAKNNNVSRSWLSESPSDDSATRRNTNLSVMSSYELSRAESDAPPDTVMGTIEYYANAAAKAVQYNLYDVPVREFEKIRELTCHHDSSLDTGRQLNLLDRDIGASDSQQDSINVGKNGEVDPSKTSANPFAVVFKELMDVLECSPQRTSAQSYSKRRAIEEAKVEMISSNSGDASGDIF